MIPTLYGMILVLGSDAMCHQPDGIEIVVPDAMRPRDQSQPITHKFEVRWTCAR